ncbi:MAG: isoprenoid synthase domain-containing protein [Monoraphidium minutum]|nr:MAG: isoprenoid synthase domain-containing protein [Monoraphidium minutum]
MRLLFAPVEAHLHGGSILLSGTCAGGTRSGGAAAGAHRWCTRGDAACALQAGVAGASSGARGLFSTSSSLGSCVGALGGPRGMPVPGSASAAALAGAALAAPGGHHSAAASRRRFSSGGGGGISIVDGRVPAARRLEPSPEELRAAFEHCAQLVSRHDAESLAWVALLPRDLRARVLALRAFGLELLLAGEAVRSKERALAAIRFQWWRDAVSQVFSGDAPPAHPVLTALWAVSREAKVGRYNLRRIIDAREEEFMRDKPPLTLEELEAHCEGTASQLLYLQLAAAGIASRDADHAASHVGKAVGISLMLRGTPYQASQRRSLLPLEVCARHKVSQEEIFRGPPASEGLRDAALDLGSAARAHLKEARALAPRLPPGAAPLLMPAVGAGLFLSALEARGFDVFHPSLAAGGASPLRRALAIKWASLRRTF